MLEKFFQDILTLQAPVGVSDCPAGIFGHMPGIQTGKLKDEFGWTVEVK